MITDHAIWQFIRRSLRGSAKDVYILPPDQLSTTRAPGCRFLGRYTEAVLIDDLREDIAHTLAEMAS